MYILCIYVCTNCIFFVLVLHCVCVCTNCTIFCTFFTQSIVQVRYKSYFNAQPTYVYVQIVHFLYFFDLCYCTIKVQIVLQCTTHVQIIMCECVNVQIMYKLYLNCISNCTNCTNCTNDVQITYKWRTNIFYCWFL